MGIEEIVLRGVGVGGIFAKIGGGVFSRKILCDTISSGCVIAYTSSAYVSGMSYLISCPIKSPYPGSWITLDFRFAHWKKHAVFKDSNIKFVGKPS